MTELNSPLGRQSDYPDAYSPQLLFPVPRQLKRDELGITAATLPFVGEDVWNAYELSWLGVSGKPVVALGCFRVPAESPYLIESKSLKLYLNSLNQATFQSVQAVHAVIARDLSMVAGRPVDVSITPLNDRPEFEVGYPEGSLLDELDVVCDRYQPSPDLLHTSGAEVIEEQLYSHLLKSNCLVTGQPDWGMVIIRYRGVRIDHKSLLQYIVSFRNHNEFHEQCVERIFCDIMAHCQPEALSVYARYTRRGGLDINPFRSSGEFYEPVNVREARQ